MSQRHDRQRRVGEEEEAIDVVEQAVDDMRGAGGVEIMGPWRMIPRAAFPIRSGMGWSMEMMEGDTVIMSTLSRVHRKAGSSMGIGAIGSSGLGAIRMRANR